MSVGRRASALAVLLAVAALAMLGFAGCGGDDDSSSGSGSGGGAAGAEGGSSGSGKAGSIVRISADPDGSLAYEQSEVSAKAGTVEVDFTNEAPIPHDVVIEQDGEDLAATDEITGSQTSTTADLKPGEYVFYCSVPGHREAGMEGELVVR